MAINFEARLPRSLPQAVNVYQLQRPTATDTMLVGLARRFGLPGQGKDFLASADGVGYREGRHEIEVHRRSGAIQFRHVDDYGRPPAAAFDLTDRRAGTVARRFLERAALFPIETAQLRGVTHLRGATADVATKQTTEQVIDAGVVFGRVVDDLPVDGPGGFAMVNVDANAEVVGLRAIWRTLGKRQAKVRIKSPAEAIRELETLAAAFKGETTVTKAGFGYFEQGGLDAQTVLEPAFWFVYVVRYGEVSHKSAFVTHAGDQVYAPLMGKKRFPGKVQLRRSKG